MTEEQARAHPGVLAGTYYAWRSKSESGGWTARSKAAVARSTARYLASPKGKAAMAKYNSSDKGLDRHARYQVSDKGIIRNVKQLTKNRKGI